MKKLIYIIITLAIALTACEKKLDFPFEYTKPKLVLNCILSNTSEIYFSVSRSMHILDNKEIVMIPDASVIIFEDDNPLQVVPVSDGEGTYHAAYIPKPGHTYKFQISKDGFDTIEAEAQMPATTTINSFNCKSMTLNDEEMYYYTNNFDINVNFNDSQEQENYYMIKVSGDIPKEMKDYLEDFYTQHNYVYNTPYDNYFLSLECNDNSVGLALSNDLIYLSDEIIGAGDYTIKFKAHDYSDLYGLFYEIEYTYDGEEGDTTETDSTFENSPFYREYEYSVVLHMQVVSKDYYQYQKSYDLFEENDGNPFAEPTQVKTNVKNGLGMLGASSEITDTVKFIIKNPYLEEGE